VSEEEWQAFLDDYITPRFEEGLTVVDGAGQYWSRSGSFVREHTKIVILMYRDTSSAHDSIEYIRSAYCRLFDQESVLRIDQRVKVSFEAEAPSTRTREMGILENRAITESSGLARSLRERTLLWTHNDSGGAPRLFAVGKGGQDFGVVHIRGAQAVDWEDMCSVLIDGEPYLLIADVGDNRAARDYCTLYLVKEPAAPGKGQETTVDVERQMTFVYEDGPCDCESVAMDGATRTVYLVGKSWGWSCDVYALPWTDATSSDPAIARVVSSLGLPMTVAMDFSPDMRSAVILTYGDAYLYRREPGDTWAEAFARDPEMIPMPKREQGESICFGTDGLRLYLTSEKLPAPLWEVNVPEE
jgi:hypothetical protein